MKFFVYLIILGFCFSTPPEDRLSTPSAINIAAHQTMLTQRIYTAYLAKNYWGLNEQEAIIKESLIQFESQMALLLDYSKEDTLKAELKKVSNLWKSYRLLAKAKASNSNKKEMELLSEQLFDACNAYTQLVKQVSAFDKGQNKQLAQVVESTGFMRINLQKIPLLLLQQKNQPKSDEAFYIQFKEACHLFQLTQQELIMSRLNRVEMDEKLSVLNKKWQKLQPVLNPIQEEMPIEKNNIAKLLEQSKELIQLADELATLYLNIERN